MIFKRSICGLVMVALLLYCMQNVIIVVQYEINKDYISSVLCENRDRPSMRCFGKCQLLKKLKKADKKEKENKSLLEKFSSHSIAILNTISHGQQQQVLIEYTIQEDSRLISVDLPPLIVPPDDLATKHVFFA